MNELPFHWEYSYYMNAGHLEKVQRTKNGRTYDVDAGLSAEQTSALRFVLKKYGFPEQEEAAEGFKLRGENGFLLNLRMWDLNEHAKMTSSIPVELIIKELDNDTLRILFDIALSTNMILSDFVGKNARFVARDPSTALLEKWPDAVRMDTIDDLRTYMTKDLGGRKIYLEDEVEFED